MAEYLLDASAFHVNDKLGALPQSRPQDGMLGIAVR